MTGFIPYYIRDKFFDDPHFEHAKIVYSYYNDASKEKLSKNIFQKLTDDGLKNEGLGMFKADPRVKDMHELALEHADGVVLYGDGHDADLKTKISDSNKPVMEHTGEEVMTDAYKELYIKVLEERKVLIDS